MRQEADQLLGLREDEKAGAMREFPPKAEGERREAGSRNFSVRKNIRDRVLSWAQSSEKLGNQLFCYNGEYARLAQLVTCPYDQVAGRVGSSSFTPRCQDTDD